MTKEEGENDQEMEMSKPVNAVRSIVEGNKKI